MFESTTDENGQIIRNTYDKVGRLDTVTGPYEIPENRITIDFEYHPEAPVPYATTRHVDRQADGSVIPDTIDTITFVDGLKRPVQTKMDATISTGPNTPATTPTFHPAPRWARRSADRPPRPSVRRPLPAHPLRGLLPKPRAEGEHLQRGPQLRLDPQHHQQEPVQPGDQRR